MRIFYLVRHGESESNVSKIRDYGGETPLTEKGRRQSEYLARRFTTLPLDAVLASPFVRTKHTAEIFNKELQKPIKYSPLLIEWSVPSETKGLHQDTPQTKKADSEIKKHFHESGWRYSDEENFDDLKKRGQQALKLLLSQKEDHVAVITHGGFIRMLTSLMMHGDELSSREFIRVFSFMKTANTGITICRYDETNTNVGWQMVTWMDHAHLGDY